MSARITRPDLTFDHLHDLVTVAPQMKRLFELVRRAARSDATVLVRGESGTGKELVAQALHAESNRSDRPFRAVNCATFTSALLASELFGHVKGAFTGAVADRMGLLSQAHQGTLFLDEVAELPLDLQARLLRVLQQRRFTPVGATEEIEVDVRVISATNAPLRQLVRDGRFREDLMYRIRVVVLYLPPLVEREGDLEALTWHFVDEFNTRHPRKVHAIDRRAWAMMAHYPWPGNIRELRNNLEQAFVLGEGPVLLPDELAPEVRGLEAPAASRIAEVDPEPLRPAVTPPGESTPVTLDDMRRAELLEAFRRTNGHRGKMAEELGISRATLYRWLKKQGLL
ncbi:MAG: sigma 54-interacting transcriptional regulator [Myxococcota bacterium]